MRQHLIRPVLLAVIAAALGAAIWLELRGHVRDSASMAALPAPALPVLPGRLVPGQRPDQAARWAAIILARPLFDPGRRPPHGAAASPDAAPSLPRVAGLVVTPAGRSVIFASTPKPLVVQEGGHVGAFTVQSIESGHVTIHGPSGVQVLSPAFGPPGSAPEPGAPQLPGGLPGPPPPPQGAAAIPGLPPPPLQFQPRVAR